MPAHEKTTAGVRVVGKLPERNPLHKLSRGLFTPRDASGSEIDVDERLTEC